MEEFWTPGRKSSLDWLRGLLFFAITFGTFLATGLYGVFHLDLPMAGIELIQCVFFTLGLFVAVAVHESGHMLAAWAVGFRFRSISVGPFTFEKQADGKRVTEFDWSKLFHAGGYLGAVPDSPAHVRSRQILIVSAGPAAALLGALLLWLLSLNLRGTDYAPHWHPISAVASVLFANFVTNLLPIGYSDGTMLWHLVWWTKRGQALCARIQTFTMPPLPYTPKSDIPPSHESSGKWPET